MNQALLVIDAQQDLVDGTLEENSVFNKENLLSTINRVVNMAIESDVLIVFVRDLDVAQGRGNGFQIHSSITVPPTAHIIDKQSTNAFYGTSLLELLQKQVVEHVVIMGCKTEHCIDSAVRAATTHGLDVTLVGDGHSTTDTKILSAEQVINHHNAILHGHDNVDNFSLVRNSGDDLFTPIHNNYR
ncbi:cysteine hydrolase family protein [Bacillus carboniphilus]|uniref:Cysteine hydrolase family protein n=1 Tax=Bacillus carboniphilus TaxID=86663 RepID=A0ABN0WJV8_9BACI